MRVNIWISDYYDNKIIRLLASSGAVVGSYAVGTSPTALAFDGANIWLARRQQQCREIAGEHRPDRGHLRGRVLPQGVTFDGTNIWVANAGSGNKVTRLLAS